MVLAAAVVVPEEPPNLLISATIYYLKAWKWNLCDSTFDHLAVTASAAPRKAGQSIFG